mmetsp:Transcript_22200/g.48478  ORF Transcript_22200/g.48478 Transcript_22200/m.48478 type:complete len:136 (+) Transcript_22200:239-646(+)
MGLELMPGPSTAAISEYKKETKKHGEDAYNLLSRYKTTAEQLGVASDRLKLVELPPKGGASGVGESLVQYAHENRSDMVVVGSRGMGGLRRALANLVGLGSVSDYMLTHTKCPVIVVKKAHSGDDGSHAPGSTSA